MRVGTEHLTFIDYGEKVHLISRQTRSKNNPTHSGSALESNNQSMQFAGNNTSSSTKSASSTLSSPPANPRVARGPKNQTHLHQPFTSATKTYAEGHGSSSHPAKVVAEGEFCSKKVQDLHLSANTDSKLEKLSTAINSGDVQALSELLPAHDPENSRLMSQLLANTNNAILMDSVRAQKSEIVSLILERVPEFMEIGHYQSLLPIAVSRENSNGLRIAVSLVRHAAKCGHPYSKKILDNLLEKVLAENLYDCIDQLLGHGADFHILFGPQLSWKGLKKEISLVPALNYHLETGNQNEIIAIASMLVKQHSADADYFDRLVICAVKAGNAAHVAQLLKIRNEVLGFGRPRSSDARDDALQAAAASGKVTILNMLLDSHPLVRPERKDGGLLSRFRNFFDDNFSYSGRFVNKPDRNGDTLLSLAVKSGSKATLVSLLNRGADLTHRNDKGHSALALAVIEKRHDVAELLLTKAEQSRHVWPEIKSMVKIASETDARMLEILVSSKLVAISDLPTGSILPEALDYLRSIFPKFKPDLRPHFLKATLAKMYSSLYTVGTALNDRIGTPTDGQVIMLSAGVRASLASPEINAKIVSYASCGFTPVTADILEKRLAFDRNKAIDAGTKAEGPMQKLIEKLFETCSSNCNIAHPHETIRAALIENGMYGLLADHIAVSFIQASLAFNKAVADRIEAKLFDDFHGIDLQKKYPSQEKRFTVLLTSGLQENSEFRMQVRKASAECADPWLFDVLLDRQIAMVTSGLTPAAVVS